MTKPRAAAVEAWRRDNALLIATTLALAEAELRRCQIAMMKLDMDAASPGSLPQA